MEINASKDYFRALGYLVYSISKVDGELSAEEAQGLAQEILDSFGDWVADTKGLATLAAYEAALNNNMEPTEAYQKALELFNNCPEDVREYRLELLGVIERVAFSDQKFTLSEKNFMQQLKEDLDKIAKI
ncbi:MAG: TerB family tellurite resistance protein [Bacteroidia bacterium]|nr:TerB family tellurite resistance protein [Bacteroidia bacterium]MDW8158587.1 TerB family tellurite resistance protein [Bacteroidia bacterium]